MDFALSGADVTSVVVLAVVLLGILFLLRLMFKLTASLFRLGCTIVFLVVAAAVVILYIA